MLSFTEGEVRLFRAVPLTESAFHRQEQVHVHANLAAGYFLLVYKFYRVGLGILGIWRPVLNRIKQ